MRRIAEDISDAPDPILVVSPALARTHDVGSFAGLLNVRAEPDRVDEVVRSISRVLPGAKVTPAQDFSQRIQSGLDVQAATLLAVAAAAAVAGIGVVAQAVVRVVRGSRADDGVRAVLGMTRGATGRSRGPVRAAGWRWARPLVSVVGGVLFGPVADHRPGRAGRARPGRVDRPAGRRCSSPAAPSGWCCSSRVAAPTGGHAVAAALGRPPVRPSRRPSCPRRPASASAAALGGGVTRWAGRSALVAAVLAVADRRRGHDLRADRSTRCSPNPTAGRPTSTPWPRRHRARRRRSRSRPPSRTTRVSRRSPRGGGSRSSSAGPGGPTASSRRCRPARSSARSSPWVRPSGAAPRSPARGAGRAATCSTGPGRRWATSCEMRDRAASTHVVRIVGEATAYGTDQMDEAIIVDPPHRCAREELDDRYLLVRFADGRRRGAGPRRAVRASSVSSSRTSAPPSTVDRLREIGSLPFVLVGFVAALGVLAVATRWSRASSATRRELATLRALGMTRRQVGADRPGRRRLTVAVVGSGARRAPRRRPRSPGLRAPGPRASARWAPRLARCRASGWPPSARSWSRCVLAGLATVRIRPFGWAPEPARRVTRVSRAAAPEDGQGGLGRVLLEEEDGGAARGGGRRRRQHHRLGIEAAHVPREAQAVDRASCRRRSSGPR